MISSVDLICILSIIEEKEFKIYIILDGMSSIFERDLLLLLKGLEYVEMIVIVLEIEFFGSKIVLNIDVGSIILDIERFDDGKELGKEIRKIQIIIII